MAEELNQVLTWNQNQNVISSSLTGCVCRRIRGVDNLWFGFHLWLLTSVTTQPHALCLIWTFFPWLPSPSKNPASPRMLLTTRNSKEHRVELHLCLIQGGAAPPISDSSTLRREICNIALFTSGQPKRALGPLTQGAVGWKGANSLIGQRGQNWRSGHGAALSHGHRFLLWAKRGSCPACLPLVGAGAQ